MKLSELVERNLYCDKDGRVLDENGHEYRNEDGEMQFISKEDLLKVKRETCIRRDTESEIYKYRDLRDMYYYGLTGWKDKGEDDINWWFDDQELEINQQDIQWASYQNNEK